MGRSGDIVKAIACGADAAMVGSPLARAQEAPGAGQALGMEATHGELPRGEVEFQTPGVGRRFFRAVPRQRRHDEPHRACVGPSPCAGYTDPKSFQRVEMVRSH